MNEKNSRTMKSKFIVTFIGKTDLCSGMSSEERTPNTTNGMNKQTKNMELDQEK